MANLRPRPVSEYFSRSAPTSSSLSCNFLNQYQQTLLSRSRTSGSSAQNSATLGASKSDSHHNSAFAPTATTFLSSSGQNSALDGNESSPQSRDFFVKSSPSFSHFGWSGHFKPSELQSFQEEELCRHENQLQHSQQVLHTSAGNQSQQQQQQPQFPHSSSSWVGTRDVVCAPPVSGQISSNHHNCFSLLPTRLQSQPQCDSHMKQEHFAESVTPQQRFFYQQSPGSFFDPNSQQSNQTDLIVGAQEDVTENSMIDSPPESTLEQRNFVDSIFHSDLSIAGPSLLSDSSPSFDSTTSSGFCFSNPLNF